MTTGIVEDGLCLGAGDGGELSDEVVDGVAAAEVVEEGVNGDACARKARRATEYVGVGDDLVHGITIPWGEGRAAGVVTGGVAWSGCRRWLASRRCGVYVVR